MEEPGEQIKDKNYTSASSVDNSCGRLSCEFPYRCIGSLILLNLCFRNYYLFSISFYLTKARSDKWFHLPPSTFDSK